MKIAVIAVIADVAVIGSGALFLVQ